MLALLMLASLASAETVRDSFPPPPGAMLAPRTAFGTWLMDRELLPEGSPVLTFSGHHVGAPHTAAEVRVVDMPMVPGDLQQCADTIYRLRADYLRETGADIVFHATNGQAIPWSRWAAGERTQLRGSTLAWVRASHSSEAAAWQSWLEELFEYAGTISLKAHDTVPVPDRAPRPGDVVVAPGSPGHAVLLFDVAKTRDGRWLVLFGEGFMPAQQLHVHRGPEDGWWEWDPTAGLPISWWTLPGEGLRRWKR